MIDMQLKNVRPHGIEAEIWPTLSFTGLCFSLLKSWFKTDCRVQTDYWAEHCLFTFSPKISWSYIFISFCAWHSAWSLKLAKRTFNIFLCILSLDCAFLHIVGDFSSKDSVKVGEKLFCFQKVRNLVCKKTFYVSALEPEATLTNLSTYYWRSYYQWYQALLCSQG